MLDWAREYLVTPWLIATSAAMFVGCLLALPLLIARIPSDYFLHRRPPEESWRAQNPEARYALRIAKNLAGAVFLMAGVAMLVLPGQGLLTILLSLMLLDFPGKRRLELKILRQRHVLRSINAIRARAGRPPLKLPEKRRRRRRGSTDDGAVSQDPEAGAS